MKVFIDFDDTLFCTKFFIKDFLNIFQRNGVSEKVFRETYYSKNKKNQGEKYNLEKQLQRLKKNGFDVKTIKREIEIFLKKSEKYVFKDVEKFLKSFKKNELYLLSYSQTEFQKKKIKISKVGRFFKKVIITDEKKSKEIEKILAKKKEETFFIDDWNKQVDEVKKEIPEIKTIFLKRKNGRYQDEKSQRCDFVVGNLREALKIIKNKK